jgi:hypothetical protein
MTRYICLLHHVLHLVGTLLTLLIDVVRFLRLCLRPAPVAACSTTAWHRMFPFEEGGEHG